MRRSPTAVTVIFCVKLCVIFNPGAGSVPDADSARAQLQRLKPFRIRVTRRRGDAEKFARAAIRAGYDWIVTAGGDGTLNEVINGIARRGDKVRLGLVPLGTGNDFARSLGLPAEVDENIDVLRSANTKRIDLVRVRSKRLRYFVNVSAGGFSGAVDEKLTPELKRAWGPLAYIRSAAAALPKLQAYRTEILLDDKERLSLDLYNVVIGNGRFVAGGLPIAPEADPSDGWLDVILIPNHPAPKIALLAGEMLVGKHLHDAAIVFRRAKKIAVRARPRMWFNVDGEPVGNAPAVFQILPRALNFVVPKR
ncbi:MAG: diacylglycerol kinase family protein [Chthoniobacterales bacterium]